MPVSAKINYNVTEVNGLSNIVIHQNRYTFKLAL